MVIGMNEVIIARLPSKFYIRHISDDLIHIHVKRCASSSLEHIEDELVAIFAFDDSSAARDNGHACLFI